MERIKVGRSAICCCLIVVCLAGCPCTDQVIISRQYRDALEERLLDVAESTYPDRDEILAVAGLPEILELPGQFLWWYRDVEQIHIPFAVTAQSVLYYAGVAQDPDAVNPFWQNARFEYEAAIEQLATYTLGEQEFKNVYVATMRLDFSVSGGTLSAMGFVKDRIVVLSPSGAVLAIAGDGETSVWVS